MKKIKKEERATLEIFKNEEKDAGLKDEEANQLLESYSALRKRKTPISLGFYPKSKTYLFIKKDLETFLCRTKFSPPPYTATQTWKENKELGSFLTALFTEK